MNFDIEVEDTRLPTPHFSREEAIQKVRMAEDAWNTRNPLKVATAYCLNSRWRNRDHFIRGRAEIVAFLTVKWNREREYRLIKELWAHDSTRIAVRFVYEWADANGQWFRSHGNENWIFNSKGLISERHASINDVSISEAQRLFLWPQGKRPQNHPGLTELGL